MEALKEEITISDEINDIRADVDRHCGLKLDKRTGHGDIISDMMCEQFNCTSVLLLLDEIDRLREKLKEEYNE